MKLSLLDFRVLKSFPSGSGIEFFDGKIYLSGDDATAILTTNKRWKKQSKIRLFENIEKRIPKNEKADLEATAILQLKNINYLLLLGSGSAEPRNKLFLMDLKTNEKIEFNCSVFYNRVKTAGILDLNIEGATQVKDLLLLCNRGNYTNPINQVVVTTTDFFERQNMAPLELLDIDLSVYEGVISVSGITYSIKNDCLLFTTSMENTSNSFDDGQIGKSYLGIIFNAYQKITQRNLKVDELIDLPATINKFEGHKIESVCIQSEKKKGFKLHLVADNDNGKTVLFKVRLKF